MGNLRYALLGLLNQKSMTGYDLIKQFDHAICEFWHAKQSQIYPELKKLTEEKMVEYTIEISGTVLEKKLYSITDLGRADFLAWLSLDEDLEVTPKQKFRLRVFFSSSLPSEQRLCLFQNQLKRHQQRLNHLKTNNEKFCGEIPASDTDLFGDYMVLKSAIMREETTCLWLAECIELMQK